jgi:hypothetical protein
MSRAAAEHVDASLRVAVELNGQVRIGEVSERHAAVAAEGAVESPIRSELEESVADRDEHRAVRRDDGLGRVR